MSTTSRSTLTSRASPIRCPYGAEESKIIPGGAQYQSNTDCPTEKTVGREEGLSCIGKNNVRFPIFSVRG